MELQQILEQRQSIRRYKNITVKEDDLKEILHAAHLAPSAKNSQNWHFVAIQNKGLLDKLADVILTKNEKIALEMDKVDTSKADRFRKFCKNFTLFWKDSTATIVITYATNYYPSGYHEYKLIEESQEILDNLLYHKNPGLQNIGAACENITLKAIDLGYSTCWLTSANYVADEIEELLKNEINFEKEKYFMVNMFAIGVPEENQKSPAKKPLEEIYTFVK